MYCLRARIILITWVEIICDHAVILLCFDDVDKDYRAL